MPVKTLGKHDGPPVLRALPPSSLISMSRSFDRTDLKRGTVLHRAGQPAKQVYFLESGLVSLLRGMNDGRTVEVGYVAKFGVTASEVLFGSDAPLLDSVVQLPGWAVATDTESLRELIAECRETRTVFQDHLNRVADRLAQSAACNRLHSLHERCSRWLLIAHDAAENDTFPLTHEFLAQMMGTLRPGVTLTLNEMQDAGLIDHRRGAVTIVNRLGLEAASCECYQKMRTDILSNNAEPDSGAIGHA